MIGRPKGWRYESVRHSYAARGISTGRRYNYVPTFVAADLPLIAGDALGVAGAEVVSLIPVAVPALLAYKGAEIVSKKVKEHKKKHGGKFMAFRTPVDTSSEEYMRRQRELSLMRKHGPRMPTLKTVHKLRLVPTRRVKTQRVPSKKERDAVQPGDSVAVIAEGMGRGRTFYAPEKMWLKVVSKKRKKLIGRIESTGRMVPFAPYRKMRFAPGNIVDIQRGYRANPHKYMSYEDMIANIIEEGDKVRRERLA